MYHSDEQTEYEKGWTDGYNVAMREVANQLPFVPHIDKYCKKCGMGLDIARACIDPNCPNIKWRSL